MTQPRQGEPAGTSGGPDNEALGPNSTSRLDSTTDPAPQQVRRDLALWNLSRAAAVVRRLVWREAERQGLTKTTNGNTINKEEMKNE